MAKIPPKVPPPRARQKGPRHREATRDAGGFARKRVPLLIAVAVAAGLLIAISVLRGGGGASVDNAALAKNLAPLGCVLKTYPSQGQNHVQSLQTKVQYNSFPPTSGPHYQQPAIWNRYSQPLALVQEVHNLEHGGVIIQYGDKVPAGTVTQLGEFYDSSPNAMLLAPLPKLGDKIVLSAWTHLATCTGYTKSAFSSFRDAYRGHGPERFQVSALKPGS